MIIFTLNKRVCFFEKSPYRWAGSSVLERLSGRQEDRGSSPLQSTTVSGTVLFWERVGKANWREGLAQKDWEKVDSPVPDDFSCLTTRCRSFGRIFSRGLRVPRLTIEALGASDTLLKLCTFLHNALLCPPLVQLDRTPASQVI